ncbi:MAG: hypothetical protein EOP38_18335 [Rubrivivax sp.]|nr:MAG: hypothetical protein EOP38_18335 [Rubrivivax sp.]
MENLLGIGRSQGFHLASNGHRWGTHIGFAQRDRLSRRSAGQQNKTDSDQEPQVDQAFRHRHSLNAPRYQGVVIA